MCNGKNHAASVPEEQLPNNVIPKQDVRNSPRDNSDNFQRSGLLDSYFTSYPVKVSEKQQDIFTTILLNILEKIIRAVPAIVQRLFGVDYGKMGSAFKYLGVIGQVATILLQLLESMSVFIKALKQNKLFRSLLLPLLILGVNSGLLFFAIWFYQDDGQEYYELPYNAENTNNIQIDYNPVTPPQYYGTKSNWTVPVNNVMNYGFTNNNT